MLKRQFVYHKKYWLQCHLTTLKRWSTISICSEANIMWVVVQEWATRLRKTCICSPLPILSPFGVDRHDCLSPCISVLSELWIELVLSQIAPHQIAPSHTSSMLSLLCLIQLNRCDNSEENSPSLNMFCNCTVTEISRK